MKSKGKEGEKFAEKFLSDKGYQLLGRNYRHKRGEIDLIMKLDNLLCFIEVKLRSRIDFGQPEDFVSENQKDSIIVTAENFMIEKDWTGDIRFDIIALTKKGSAIEVKHFKDAFY
jgi:putative endonuclease